jgi:transcriptional regulator with XRE-family HTH domain
MTIWKPWADRLVSDLAAVVKGRRRELGLTAAELSERTAVGKPLSRAVISDLETGRKLTLDVSELITLATALDLSPLSLVVPNVLDEVEILPGTVRPGTEVLAWFMGIEGESPGDKAIQLAIRLVEIELALEMYRERIARYEDGHRVLSVLHESMEGFEKGEAEHAQRQIKALEVERKTLSDEYLRITEVRRDA